MAKKNNILTMRVFNRGKRDFNIKTGIGKGEKVLNPQTGLEVSERVGKNLIEAYPREIVDAADLTGSVDINKKAALLDKKEKELEAREKALKEKEVASGKENKRSEKQGSENDNS